MPQASHSRALENPCFSSPSRCYYSPLEAPSRADAAARSTRADLIFHIPDGNRENVVYERQRVTGVTVAGIRCPGSVIPPKPATVADK